MSALTVLLCAGLQYTASGFTACNDYRACASLDIGDKQFACWGHESCTNAVLTGTDSMPRYLDCNGDSSCKHAILDGFQYAYCQGKNSCDNATLSADHIECGGYGSCQDINKETINTRNMYCEGSFSCSESDINSGVTVNCNAHKSCLKSQIQSKDGILCNGINSCSDGLLQSKMGEIACNGKASCRNSRIIAMDIKAYAHFSAAFSDLNAGKIHAMGYYSLLYANIDSLNREEINVTAYGALAGYGATFLCETGSKCVLDCKGSGCQHMEFICLQGAQCNIIPSDCSIDDDVDCPFLRESVSLQQDIDLREYIKQKKSDQIQLSQLYIDEGNDRLTEIGIKKEYGLFNNILKYVLYSNIFPSFIVFLVTLILSIYYYSMKYKNSIYTQIP